MNFKKALGYTMVASFCLMLVGGISASIGIMPAIILIGGSALAGGFLATGMNLITNN